MENKGPPPRLIKKQLMNAERRWPKVETGCGVKAGFGVFGENPGSHQLILPSLNPGHQRGLGSWGGFVL